MVSHWRALLMALLFLTGGAAAPASTPGASTAGVERVEPPNWWVGMRHPELQLLIEGPGVAALKPRLRAHRGVRLAGVFASAWAEPVTFHNTLQDRPFTQTVYLARTAAEVPPAA